jgi:hypothetical protein
MDSENQRVYESKNYWVVLKKTEDKVNMIHPIFVKEVTSDGKIVYTKKGQESKMELKAGTFYER